MINEEIKTEVLDDMMIKTEPPDEVLPEFVEVSEELLVASIKHEHDNSDLNLVKFQPNYTIPQQNVRTGQVRDMHHISKHLDLSIFWKAFQDQGNELQGIKLTSENCLGSILLNAMCAGKLPLKLPSDWNAYFVREHDEVSMLIAQMCVKGNLPVMKRQIIINNSLQVSVFFGTHKISNIDLCMQGINGVECIESIVTSFAHCNLCRGLSPDVQVERWASVIMLDSYMNKHTFRHLKCNSVSQTQLDQCSHCKYLEVRDRKFIHVKRNKYVTSSMLLNYKSWQNMRNGVSRLRKCINRLKRGNIKLRRKLRECKNVVKEVISTDVHHNGVAV